MNANCGGRDHGAVYVERQVIEWCRELFGFPDDASGIVVSGTSMATLIGLAVARHHLAGVDVRADGIRAAPAPLVGYASMEAHGSVARAFEILGLGGDALRRVPVDRDYRIDTAVAAPEHRRRPRRRRAAVPRGRDRGHGQHRRDRRPRGAGRHLRPGEALAARRRRIRRADRAQRRRSSHGSPASSAPNSLAFDFHKWLHVPYDAGCVLVRRGDLHRAAFAMSARLSAPRRARPRRRRSLVLRLRAGAVARLSRAQGVVHAQGARRAAARGGDRAQLRPGPLPGRADRRGADGLELMAPVALNIVCFRLPPTRPLACGALTG